MAVDAEQLVRPLAYPGGDLQLAAAQPGHLLGPGQHLLAPLQRLFGPAMLGDVAEDPRDPEPLVGFHREHRFLHDPPDPIGPADRVLLALHRRRQASGVQDVERDLPQLLEQPRGPPFLGRQPVLDLPQGGSRRPAPGEPGDRLQGSIPLEDEPLLVGEHDAVQRVLHQAPEPQVALVQGLPGAPAVAEQGGEPPPPEAVGLDADPPAQRGAVQLEAPGVPRTGHPAQLLEGGAPGVGGDLPQGAAEDGFRGQADQAAERPVGLQEPAVAGAAGFARSGFAEDETLLHGVEQLPVQEEILQQLIAGPSIFREGGSLTFLHRHHLVRAIPRVLRRACRQGSVSAGNGTCGHGLF